MAYTKKEIEQQAKEFCNEWLPKPEYKYCKLCDTCNCKNNETCIECNCQF